MTDGTERNGWFGSGGGASTSPILEEVETLDTEIEEVEDFDTIEEELESENIMEIEDEASISSLQNENYKLQNEVIADEETIRKLEKEIEAGAAVTNYNDPFKDKEDYVETINVSRHDENLASPKETKAFEVNGIIFKAKNSALEYEVCQRLIDIDLAEHHTDYSCSDCYDEDDGDGLDKMGQYIIPLDVLANNIDRVAELLREYEQKKDR